MTNQKASLPEFPYIQVARSLIGLKEIKGSQHEPKILEMLKVDFNAVKQRQFIFDDETAWCGTFVAYCLASAGLADRLPFYFYRAKAWATVGRPLKAPAYGCIAVFDRVGGGHVGFIVGKTSDGLLKVLGGNQADSVNIADFDPARVVAYRWVSVGTEPFPYRSNLDTLPKGRISTNEA